MNEMKNLIELADRLFYKDLNYIHLIMDFGEIIGGT
jgi:hypothetical protein